MPTEDAQIQKLLFVCSQNKRRSLTAEKLFESFAPYQVRSAGTQRGARIVVTEGHLGWADIIFCMEKPRLNRLRRKFPEALEGKRIICLHIPDHFWPIVVVWKIGQLMLPTVLLVLLTGLELALLLLTLGLGALLFILSTP